LAVVELVVARASRTDERSICSMLNVDHDTKRRSNRPQKPLFSTQLGSVVIKAMIRLKVRLESTDALAKIIRVSEEIKFPMLLEKIAHRLGVPRSRSTKQERQQWRLLLGGDVLIEDTQELDDGDDLVLITIPQPQPAVKVEPEATKSSSSSLSEDKKSYVNRRIAKLFDNQVYFGTIDRFVNDDSNNNPYWHVQYDDGDDEEFYESDLGQVLELYETEKESDTNINTNTGPEEAKLNDAQDDADFIQDVTEQVLKEKKRRLEDQAIELESESETNEEQKDDEESTSSSSDDESNFQDSDDISDDCLDQVKTTVRESNKKKKASADKEPPLQVLMDEKDVPSAPGKSCAAHDKDQETSETTMDASSSLLVDKHKHLTTNNEADTAVRERIIKLLNTGFHDKSNEHEAKNAMRLAQRLMRKHNLSQALLLQERENKVNAGTTTNNDKDGEILKGGMVEVQIVNRNTKRAAQFARWIAGLVHPICKNFEVESFHCSRRGWQCDVTFYGIYTNAQLAAYAFRLATERISQMAAAYTPEKKSTTYRSDAVPTKSARLSYALGIVQGLVDEVDANMRREEEQRRKKLENVRRAVSTGEAYDESDDEDQAHWGSNDDNDCESHDGGGQHSFPDKPMGHGNGGSETANAIPAEESKATTTVAKRLEDLEKEESAAIVLVDHREKIAEEVLKEKGIKLRSGRKRKAITFDWNSYRTGIEDSKEIDINQRALRDSARVKKEKR
jgi:hypothetical protein